MTSSGRWRPATVFAVLAGGMGLAATRAGAAPAAPAMPPPIAIVGATVYPADGPKLEHATLLLQSGRIAAVGADSAVAVPADAVRIDGSGKVVTPGFVDALTAIGLADVPSEETDTDAGLGGAATIRAAYSAADALNPRSWRIPIVRMGGLTSVVVAPQGGLLAGSAAWLDLVGGGEGTEGTIVRAPLAMIGTLGNPSRAVAGDAFGGQLLYLREALDDAREYDTHRAQFEANGLRKLAPTRLDLEALVRVVRGEEPLYLQVHRASAIEAALRLAADENVRLVIAGAEEAWRVAPELAAAQVPVVLDPYADLPYTFDSLGARLDNAARCASAGVKVAFTSGTEYVQDPAFPRTLRQRAGVAVANGMPYDAALAAVTRVPAEALGMGADYGTLAPGKVANVVVWSGDPFELSTVPEHVIVEGHDLPLRSRQTLLRERYRARDLAASSQPAWSKGDVPVPPRRSEAATSLPPPRVSRAK